MSISFIRIDDRMIHGQTVTRWTLEYPCDGLIAVNDNAAKNPVLKAAYKSASDKKTFIWTKDEFMAKSQKVLDSDSKYFLIVKDPLDMADLLINRGLKPGITDVIVGPCNDRDGAIKLGNNQSVTTDEAAALEEINENGYNIEFALIKEAAIGNWTKFRSKFGYK